MLAALVYAAFLVYLTWPLSIDLNSRIFAIEPGDPMGSIAVFGELVDGPHSPFWPGTLEDFDFPSGTPIDWSVNVAAFPSTFLIYVLALALGPVPAWGLFTMLGFFASAMAMFFFLRKYTGNPWVALIFGFAFGFYPFTLLTAHSAHLIHGWVFVLLGWRMLRVTEEPTPRNGLLAGAAALLAFSWTPYFILFGGVCWATFLAADLIGAARARRFMTHVRAQGAGAAVLLVYFGLLQALWHLAHPITVPPDASSTVITQFAARPIEYVLPPEEHPLFGRWTGGFISDRVEPSGRVYPIYVGLVLLTLGCATIVVGLRRRERLALTFAAVGIVAAVFSMPPNMDVLGVSVPFPSALTSELVPSWRIYSRFVVVVMFAVCVLAALGATFFLQRARGWLRLTLLAALFVAIPLDLWATPPVRTTKIVPPPIYEIVKQQPPGALAEYPLRPSDLSGNYSHLFYQRNHRKPILNGYPPRSKTESRALQLSRLDDPMTPNVLSALGVKYVLLRHDREFGMIEPGKPLKDFKQIAGTPYAALYRIEADPSRSTVFPLKGFYLPEGQPPNLFRWVVEDEAKLLVRAPCDPCVGTLEFRSASFARTRLLAVLDDKGRALLLKRIDATHPTWVRVPLRFSRQTLVTLRTSPPPDPIAELIGGTDARRVSISLIQPARFVRTP